MGRENPCKVCPIRKSEFLVRVTIDMRLVAIVLFGLALTGCVTTNVVKPLSEAEQGIRNINKVTVSYSELSKSELKAADQMREQEKADVSSPDARKFKPLKEALSEIVKEHLEQRDTDGKLYADVEIEIDNLKLANAALIWLVGDNDQLTGTVRVHDSDTKVLLTEVYVDILEGNGGLLGLAIRGSGVRERLSLEFAERIGDQLGFAKLEKKYSE
ncbi:MAG: hypothetical protein JKX94_03405 [Sneathiella sp.]|nr:hypothetical protein [Sneathiella sp.]